MIVNPGIRRFLGSAIQRLFNSASFYAPLTHSLVLERGTGSPTFTRASTATVMGYGPTDNAVDGLKLLTVAANEARFVGARRISEGVWSNTFADGSLIPAATNTGYLAEEARTNLCLQSNAFTTTWATTGAITPVQNAMGPDGATSAWTLTDDDAASTEIVYISTALTNAVYTSSVFVKKTVGVQSSYPLFVADSNGDRMAITTIDTSNGVCTSWTAYTGRTLVTISSNCTNYNDDYWRVSLTYTADTIAVWGTYLIPAGTTSATYAGPTFQAAATGSAVFYGAQIELGSFASSYIATTTLAVARNADVDQYPTTAGPIAAVGAISLEYTPTHTPSGTIALWGTYVNASNYTAILHDATNLIFRKRIAGVNYDATIANAFTANTTYKVCGSWGASGVTVTVNGTEGTPHANTTAAQIAATMQWGADGNSLQQPFATERNARVWQRQLSASERMVVTS